MPSLPTPSPQAGAVADAVCRLSLILFAFTLPCLGQAPSGSPIAGQTMSSELRAGTVAGAVTDPSGALIPGARIALRLVGKTTETETATDMEGQFSIADVPPGRYLLQATAPGFTSWQSPQFTLRPGEKQRLEDIVLAVPGNHADAYVTMNRQQIAAAELHMEEKQRIFGFPDFYTSFVWDAAPLDARQKFSLGLHATTDRMAFVTAGLIASGEQVANTFPDFGGGWEGFGKRYGAAYADGFIGKIIGGAVLPSLFRQDPRYFYMGPNATVKRRVRHAVASAFLARGDNGHLQPNYSHILGNASAGALSTLYHPESSSAGSLALRNALLGTVGAAGVNVVRELFLKRFVRGGDPNANGMR